ncbi:MAG TPA: agmatinase [Clostridia bacterium]|nr:agmatinase [Clostridia bacterium]
MDGAWGELYTGNDEEADVLIKGIPFDGATSCGKGAWLAPSRIRHLSGFMPPVTEDGVILERIKVADLGDISLDLNWERYFATIEEEASRMIGTGKFCLFLGGDHSITIPLQRALAKVNRGEPFAVIHFDAHTDLCDEYDGHKWSHACTERRALDLPGIGPAALTFLGVRSYEPQEVEFLRAHPEVRIISASEVYRHGIEKAVEVILGRASKYESVYFTLDIDVLDPGFAPGTGTPEGGGISTRELLEAVKVLVSNLPIKVMDVVEVAPPLDISDITSWAALKVIYEAFGALSSKHVAG